MRRKGESRRAEARGTIRANAVPSTIELEKAERVRDAETLARWFVAALKN